MAMILNRDDRQELIDAAIVNYRDGVYGPISFRMRMRQIGGVAEDEITALLNQHIDECAKNKRSS